MRAARPGLVYLTILALLGLGCGDGPSTEESSPEGRWTVDAGAVALHVRAAPWGMTLADARGAVLLEHPSRSDGPTGALGLHVGPPPEGDGSVPSLTPLARGEPATPPGRDRGWVRATEVRTGQGDGTSWTGTLATTDPDRTIEVHVAVEGDGVISVRASASDPEGVQAVGVAFRAEASERFVGFGERGNAVDQAGNAVESYVAEGPYQDDEYSFIGAVVPKWGVRWRRDTTYFPIPWLLSSRGYGVLLDNDEKSDHRVGSETPDAWSMEVESTEMRFRVFAGPSPREALARYSAAVGRQPRDYAPWFLGPWVQTDTDDRIDDLRMSDVPTSVTATFLHYLPCGGQQGREQEQIDRTAALHAKGTAVHTYFNPMICVDYAPAFAEAEARDALLRSPDGGTYVYTYFTSRPFEVSQFDFSAPNGVAAYRALTDEALSHGYDGWMEDFGEYTPLDARAADGATGTGFHNRYPRDYHCGVAAATAGAGKPLARFVRSGWTGSAACSPIVWGGDPTTGFGFDGLESSIYQALSIGTSGVGLWGSDIGGFFAVDPFRLTDELLDRWIAFGALSVVMRSQKDGIAIPAKERPQPWDPAHHTVWRRYAKLHTRLFPYLQAAVEEYYETGLPVMRHHVLTHPDDDAAIARDDQYLFGADLLVAPVYVEGAREREVHLPEGPWIDWWRSVAYDEATGRFDLGRATTYAGGGTAVIPAPLDEIPLLVRAGAVLPLLAPDVFTLAPYGDDPSIVHLSDRADDLFLLAFPYGDSSGRLFASERYESRSSDGVWTLRIEGESPRTIHLQASLGPSGLEPCHVTLDGTTPPDLTWSYDSGNGVLEARYRTRRGELRVDGC